MLRKCRFRPIFSCLYYFFCIFSYFSLLFFAIGYFIFWMIFLPQEPKFYITDASLTQFDYNAFKSTLHYNLALNITIRNPNKRVGVYFNRIQVIPHYRKKRFALVTLNSSAPFYQGHKNTTVLSASIQGQQLLLFKEKDLKQYDSETSLGFYTIDLKLALRLRVKFGKIKSWRFKPSKVKCKLKIPLSNYYYSNGTIVNSNGYTFKASTCRNVYIFTKPHSENP